jgi:hypothetical protein
MLYAILCYSDEGVVEAWSKEEDAAVIGKRRAVTRPLAAAGKLGPVVRLMPTSAAVTIRSGREPLVIDGPFAETKEQFLGFYTLECADLDEAVEFARELSEVNPSGGSYEIRPVSVFNPSKAAA